ALELGAVDFVTKPRIDVARGVEAYASELIAQVKVAARAGVCAEHGAGRPATPPAQSKAAARPFGTTEKLIVIGASTGGTEAIKWVLKSLPADAPAIVIAEHIPAAFSAPFAARMDRS